MTVHWLSLNRAISISWCYSGNFAAPTQDYLERVQRAPAVRMIEGPNGTLTLFTLAKSHPGSRRNFLLYATLKKEELVNKLLPVDEDSLSLILGEGWSLIGNGEQLWEQYTYTANGGLTNQQMQWQQMEQQPDACLVQVWDNGDSLSDRDIADLQQRRTVEEFPTEHVGLQNIYCRLKWMNKENALRLLRPEQGGFMAEMRIKEEKTE